MKEGCYEALGLLFLWGQEWSRGQVQCFQIQRSSWNVCGPKGKPAGPTSAFDSGQWTWSFGVGGWEGEGMLLVTPDYAQEWLLALGPEVTGDTEDRPGVSHMKAQGLNLCTISLVSGLAVLSVSQYALHWRCDHLWHSRTVEHPWPPHTRWQ